MIPSNALALVAFLVAVAPGYIYLRITERRIIRRSRSPLLEVVDLLCVGALCTAIGIGLSLAVGELFPRAFLRLRELSDPSVLTSWRFAASLIVALALAGALAALLAAAVVRRRASAAALAGGTPRTAALQHYAREAGHGATVYAVVRLRSGQQIAGRLQFADTAPGADGGDLVLTRPIVVETATDQVHLEHDFVIVQGREVDALFGRILRPTPAPRPRTE